MWKFPARFEPQPDGGFCVSFRDIPEALTQGDTLEEAQAMALDALVTALDFYFEGGNRVPEPSLPRVGEWLVVLPDWAVGKVERWNAKFRSFHPWRRP